VVTRLVEQVNPTVVIAEAVGSCTDLQSTVVRPLRQLHGDQLRTAPLTVAVDPVRHAAMTALTRHAGTEPDLAYLYRHQLDEADIIAVNKVDLLTPAAVATLTADLAAQFPHAQLVATAPGQAQPPCPAKFRVTEPSSDRAGLRACRISARSTRHRPRPACRRPDARRCRASAPQARASWRG
jgi:G3E family GTPase